MKNGPYELIKPPEDYPGKRYRGRYAYEHHVVWWQNTGELVPDGFLIHHINDKKRDNRFENLEMMSVSKHTAMHKDIGEAKFHIFECAFCGITSKMAAKNYRYKTSIGQKEFCCSRSCARKNNKIPE